MTSEIPSDDSLNNLQLSSKNPSKLSLERMIEQTFDRTDDIQKSCQITEIIEEMPSKIVKNINAIESAINSNETQTDNLLEENAMDANNTPNDYAKSGENTEVIEKNIELPQKSKSIDSNNKENKIGDKKANDYRQEIENFIDTEKIQIQNNKNNDEFIIKSNYEIEDFSDLAITSDKFNAEFNNSIDPNNSNKENTDMGRFSEKTDKYGNKYLVTSNTNLEDLQQARFNNLANFSMSGTSVSTHFTSTRERDGSRTSHKKSKKTKKSSKREGETKEERRERKMSKSSRKGEGNRYVATAGSDYGSRSDATQSTAQRSRKSSKIKSKSKTKTFEGENNLDNLENNLGAVEIESIQVIEDPELPTQRVKKESIKFSKESHEAVNKLISIFEKEKTENIVHRSDSRNSLGRLTNRDNSVDNLLSRFNSTKTTNQEVNSSLASNPAIEKHSSFKSNIVTHKIQPMQFTATSINTLGSSQTGSVDKSNTNVGANQKEFLPGNEPDELIVKRKVSTSKRNIKNMINVFEAANDGSYTNASDFKNKLKDENVDGVSNNSLSNSIEKENQVEQVTPIKEVEIIRKMSTVSRVSRKLSLVGQKNQQNQQSQEFKPINLISKSAEPTQIKENENEKIASEKEGTTVVKNDTEITKSESLEPENILLTASKNSLSQMETYDTEFNVSQSKDQLPKKSIDAATKSTKSIKSQKKSIKSSRTSVDVVDQQESINNEITSIRSLAKSVDLEDINTSIIKKQILENQSSIANTNNNHTHCVRKSSSFIERDVQQSQLVSDVTVTPSYPSPQIVVPEEGSLKIKSKTLTPKPVMLEDARSVKTMEYTYDESAGQPLLDGF